MAQGAPPSRPRPPDPEHRPSHAVRAAGNMGDRRNPESLSPRKPRHTGRDAARWARNDGAGRTDACGNGVPLTC